MTAKDFIARVRNEYGMGTTVVYQEDHGFTVCVTNDDETPWVAFDVDAEWLDAFETKQEAIDYVAALEAAKLAEEREETIEALRDQVREAVDACDDPAILQDVLARLGW